MGRIPPRRIRLNFRKRLIRKRLNPPNAAACVKYDLLTGFGTARPSFNEIHLYRTSGIGGGDLRDLDGWLGRHTSRITTGEQDTHDYERGNRSMLLEGGSVREGAHTPPNVGNILLGHHDQRHGEDVLRVWTVHQSRLFRYGVWKAFRCRGDGAMKRGWSVSKPVNQRFVKTRIGGPLELLLLV